MRVFACMNPSFEIGKKDLPENIKNSFTKINYKISNEISEVLGIIKMCLKVTHNIDDKT